MFVELVGEDVAELRVRADALLAAAGASDGFVVTDPARGDGAVEDPGRRCRTGEHQSGPTGLSRLGGRSGAGEHLGSYLRDFDRLLDDHGFDGLPYGHFGDGCVHVRIDFPLTEEGGASELPGFRRGGGAAGRPLRRLAVGRARRRPGPVGAAASDVFSRCP